MRNRYKKSFRAPGVLMILVLICSAAFTAKASTTAVWKFGGNTFMWSDATNWIDAAGGGSLPGSGVPTSSDDVLIPDTSAGNPVLDAGDEAASLTIESTHEVTVSSGWDLTVGGSITGAGKLNLSAASGTVVVGGDFTIGTLTAGSSSTVTLNGATIQNISANTFHSLVDNNSGSGTNVATLTGNVTVTGNITGTGALIANGHNLTVNGNISGIAYSAGSGTTTLTGNLAISTFNAGTSLMILNGTGRQLQNAFTFNNLEIDNTGTSEQFFDDQTIKGTLSGSGTLDGGSITVTLQGDVTISNIIPNATKYFLSGTTANQNISSGYTFYELHVNNSASTNAGATLTGGDVTVSHLFSLDAGIMTLGSNNLILSTPVTGLTGTPSATSYVRTNSTGALEWSASTSGGTIFPVGDASYNPIVVAPQTTADVYDVRAADGITDALGVQATNNTVNVTWYVTPAAISSQGVVVTPQWTSSSPNQELAGFNHSSSSDYVAYRTSPSASWTPTTAGTPSNASPIFSLASGNPGGVSDITMANGTQYLISMGNGSALPVSLIAFDARYRDGKVNLAWQTASEINNSHFDVERSIDGVSWMLIGTQEGHGNSLVMNSYSMIDNLQGVVPAGTFYYRLKQVDFNGQFAYSPIKAVTIGAAAATMETYPNPTADVLNVSWTSATTAEYIITIKDLSGKQIYSEVVSGEGATNRQIDMTSYKAGTYYVQLSSGTDVTSKMVLRK